MSETALGDLQGAGEADMRGCNGSRNGVKAVLANRPIRREIFMSYYLSFRYNLRLLPGVELI